MLIFIFLIPVLNQQEKKFNITCYMYDKSLVNFFLLLINTLINEKGIKGKQYITSFMTSSRIFMKTFYIHVYLLTNWSYWFWGFPRCWPGRVGRYWPWPVDPPNSPPIAPSHVCFSKIIILLLILIEWLNNDYLNILLYF